MGKEAIVVVGTGWAGYTLSQLLDVNKFDVTIISPEETSPYTPLLASAACGLFDFSLAEEPVRRKNRSISFYKARVEDVDFASKVCKCRAASEIENSSQICFDVPYDRLLLAPGCTTNTFGTPGALEHAFFVRNVADAQRVQRRIMELLELASLPGVTDEEQRDLLHIVVVGGGPTGVEISAELSDLFNDDFARLYPNLKGKMRISIHDAAHFILGAFEESLRQHAIESFSKRHVQVITDSKIKEISADSITTETEGKVRCGMTVWTAGNKQCALVDQLSVAKTDRLPRILTDDYLHVLDANKAAMADVYALGDAADIKKHFLPTTAEVAVQKAEYLARALNADDYSLSFTYRQRPLVAYLGGHDGVVAGRPQWSGPRAWAAWRSKNLIWTRTWRYKFLILASWMLNWLGGREIARA